MASFRRNQSAPSGSQTVSAEEVAQPLCDELGDCWVPDSGAARERHSRSRFLPLARSLLQQVRKQFSGPLSVELRTRITLTSRYLSVLATHGVSHVLNSWTKMPSIGQQFALLQQSQAEWSFYLSAGSVAAGVRYAEASGGLPMIDFRARGLRSERHVAGFAQPEGGRKPMSRQQSSGSDTRQPPSQKSSTNCFQH